MIKHIKILLIEDNSDHFELVKTILADVDNVEFDMAWAKSLAKGLKYLTKKNIDVILLDLNLPDSSGIESFIKINAHSYDKPILIMSALDDEELALEIVHAGAEDYLIKGQIDSRLIRQSIFYAIERKRLKVTLEKVQVELKSQVKRKTADLEKTNEDLRNKISEQKKIEKAIKANEIRFRAITERAAIGIALVNPDGCIMECNPALQKMLGYNKQELCCMTFLEITHPDDINDDLELSKELFAGKLDHFQLEKRYIQKDGEVIWGNLTASLVRDEEGNVKYAVGMVENITERKLIEKEINKYRQHLEDIVKERTVELKRANEELIKEINERKQTEEVLKDSEAKWRFLVENAPDIIFTMNRDGKILFINHAPEGMTPETTVGTSAYDYVPPEHRETVKQSIQRVFQTGKADSYEIAARGPNDTVSWYATRLGPIKESGEIVAAILITRDISERKKREREYKTIIQTAHDGFWCCDNTGYFLDVNDAYCELIGYSRDELLTMNIKDVEAQETAQETTKHIQQIIAVGYDKFETCHRKKDGGIIDFEVSANYLDTDGGLFFVFIRDIRDRKQAEKERLIHLSFLKNCEQIDKVIQKTADFDRMMSDVLKTMFSIFDCDRTWLLFPCDPSAKSWKVPMEKTRPEYPGAFALEVDIPMTPEAADAFKMALESEGPIIYDQKSGRSIPAAKQFSIQSQIVMAIYPKLGKPWLLGMHQCSYARVWTEEECKLFREITYRLSDSLSNLLFLRNLKESEEQYRNLYENNVIGLWRTSIKDGSFIKINRNTAKNLGFDNVQKLIETHKVSDFYPSDKRGALLKTLSDNGEVNDFEIPLTLGNGVEKDVSLCARIYPEKGYLEGSVVDITRRKKAESLLKASKKEIEKINISLKDRVQKELEKSRQKDFVMMHQSRLADMGMMIGNIAHQWKQPLNALNILLFNIKDSFESDELNEETIDELVTKGNMLVNKMASTIDDFRDFFKPNKEKEEFSVNKTIKESLNLIDAGFRYNNISVSLNEKEAVNVFGCTNEYSQVIINILNNAKDAIIEKDIVNGNIRIDAFYQDNAAVVKIKDNAGGIPEDILNHIFDPYFSTKEEGKGTGIGLYMCKMIIEEHMNGYIDVKNIDEGAEFSIVINREHL